MIPRGHCRTGHHGLSIEYPRELTVPARLRDRLSITTDRLIAARNRGWHVVVNYNSWHSTSLRRLFQTCPCGNAHRKSAADVIRRCPTIPHQ
jgi:hypothetical protein